MKKSDSLDKRPNLKTNFLEAALRLALTLGCVAFPASPLLGAQAEAAAPEARTPTAPSGPRLVTSSAASPLWANRGRWNFGAQLGFAVENDIGHNLSQIKLLIAQPEVAFIVGNFARSPVRRFDIVSQGILGNAVHPGGRVTGYALLFRLHGRNYRRVVPFFDLGAGVQNTTLYTKVRELNGSTQFSPQTGPGFEYYFNPQRALVLQYRYMHMSNANLQPPNLGFNASMLSIGFHWLRRPRPVGWQPSHQSHNPFHQLFGKD